MKKYIFYTIFVLFFSASAYAKGHIQEGLYKVFTGEDDLGLFVVEFGRDAVRDGVAIQFFPDGDVQVIAWYDDGLLHGSLQSFWSDGQRSFLGEYRRGVFDGAVQSFSREGKPHFKLEYENGRLQGIGYFYEDDRLVQKVQYRDGYSVAVEPQLQLE